MEVADLDFRRLIAQADSVESNECEGPNQKAEQIKPPRQYQDIPHHRSRRNIARRSSHLSFQATPIIVWRKECKAVSGRLQIAVLVCSLQRCAIGGLTRWRMPHVELARCDGIRPFSARLPAQLR